MGERTRTGKRTWTEKRKRKRKLLRMLLRMLLRTRMGKRTRMLLRPRMLLRSRPLIRPRSTAPPVMLLRPASILPPRHRQSQAHPPRALVFLRIPDQPEHRARIDRPRRLDEVPRQLGVRRELAALVEPPHLLRVRPRAMAR